MPSSIGSFSKAKSVYTLLDGMRGWKYSIVPDLIISVPTFAAAELTGANSGFFSFVAPANMIFLGGHILWTTAGTNTLRVKKVLAAATTAAGLAADASNVDISAAVDLTASANVARDITPVITSGANRIARGDKVAIASAAGTASLVGARAFLRFAFA
jgi:hypothetical protein